MCTLWGSAGSKTTKRKFFVGIVAVLTIVLIVSACKDQRVIREYMNSERTVHDTVYIDSFIVEKHDTVFVDAQWLRRAFETTQWKTWTNYKDRFSVDYPACMKRNPNAGERNLHAEYHGVTMVVTTYDDAEEIKTILYLLHLAIIIV